MRSTHGGINNESEPDTDDSLKQEYCNVPENDDMAIHEEYFEEDIKPDVTLKQEYCSKPGRIIMEEENFKIEEDIKPDNNIKQEYCTETESDRTMQNEEYNLKDNLKKI